MASEALPVEVQWLEETKARLIKLKVDEYPSFDGLVEILAQLVSQLRLLEHINEHTIVIVDSLSIWLTRATQFMKKQKVSALEFSHSYAHFNYIFTYIDQLHQSSLGAFTNAISGLLKKLLEFSDLMGFPEELVCGWIDLVFERPHTHKSFYVIMEVLLKLTVKSAELILRHHAEFATTCVEALKHVSLANSASKCLSLYLKRLHDPRKQTVRYIEEWTSLIRDFLGENETRSNLVAHSIPMVFREIPEQYVPWVRSILAMDGCYTSNRSPRVILPLLQAGMQLSKANDPFECGLVLDSDVEKYLLDTDSRLRLDAFVFVCGTIKTTNLPPYFSHLFFSNQDTLRCMIAELLTPDERTEFITNFRSALLRLKVFADKCLKKKDDEGLTHLREAQNFFQLVYDTMHSLLIPDLSYAQLSVATEMLLLMITDEFDGVSRTNKSSTAVEHVRLFTPRFACSLLRGSTNNYDDIRRRCSIMLSYCPYELLMDVLKLQPPENSFNLLLLVKYGSAERSAVFFKTIAQIYVNNSPENYYVLLERTIIHLKSCLANRAPIHGQLAALSAILNILTQSVAKSFPEKLQMSASGIVEILEQQRHEIPLNVVIGDENTSMTDNSAFWKVLKESAVLYEALFRVNQLSKTELISEASFLGICNYLMDQLTTVTHRGTFSAILLAFMKCCSICYSGVLAEKPGEWLQDSLALVKSKRQLVSRRSAGLPFLIGGILVATISQKSRIEKYTGLSFKTLMEIANENVECSEQSKVDLPQVNAFNCMTQIFRDSALRKHYHKYMGKALNIALEHLNHEVWAIKNSALMLFTALQSSFFGSNKLDGVIPSVNVELFFSQYPETRKVLLSHLEKLLSESVNEAIPILSILSRLRATSGSEDTIAPFKRLVQEKYFAHKLWNVREIAATLIANMTRTEDISNEIESLIPSVTDGGNASHGRLQCILELSRRSERLSFSRDIIVRFSQLFEAHRNTSSAFKWVFMRLCIMIAYELDGCLKGFVNLSDALKESQVQLKGLDGCAKLFISTTVPIFMQSQGGGEGDSMVASRNILRNWELEEVLLAGVQHMLTDPDKYICDKELYNDLIGVMKQRKMSQYVFKHCLQLAAEAPFSTDEFADDTAWPEEWICYNLRLRAGSESLDTKEFTKRFLNFSNEDQSETLRKQALLAAKKFLKHQVEESAACEITRIQFQIHLMESDESTEIRRIARQNNAHFLKDMQWFMEFFRQITAKEVMKEYLVNSLTKSIKDAEKEMQTTRFDLERDNLYRNEVYEFETIAKTLYEHNGNLSETDSEISLCLKKASMLVQKNKNVISSWTYLTHLDTMIRKVRVLLDASNDQKLKGEYEKALELLENLCYPFF